MLVEALIAFLILSTGIVVCLQSLGQSLKAAKKVGYARQWTEKMRPLILKMEAAQGNGTPVLALDRLDPDLKNLGAT